LILWKILRLIDAPTRRSLLSLIRKNLLHTLVLQRRNSSTEINVFAFLAILFVVAANITACTIKITNRSELARRCGTIFMINVVPLYLGGRTNLFADRILRVPLGHYSTAHRWMGRICIIQGLVHSIINASMIGFSPLDMAVSVLRPLLYFALIPLAAWITLNIRWSLDYIYQATHV